MIEHVAKTTGTSRKGDGATTLTEDEVARLFEQANANRFRFNATRGRWHVCRDGIWCSDETGAAFDAIRLHVREHAPATMHRATAVAGVEKLCRVSSTFAVTWRNFDRNPFVLGTPTGIVDLQTGKLGNADPGSMISKTTTVAPGKAAPTAWLQFLAEATGGDADLIAFLQKIAGYALTGDTREHALFFVYGDGGTGKSTFVNTLQNIMGGYAKTAPMDTFVASSFDKHPTDLAMLAGMRLVAANETEQGRRWAAARITSLTGGDPIAARFMRQDFFEFVPTFKLLFVGNHAPSFETVDEAMRRRFFVIPFDRKPRVKDERLMAKLAAEAAGILQWAIEGCLAWQSSGFVAPTRVREATDEYFSTQDLFTQWLAERVNGSDQKATTTKADALGSWNTFRQASGERPETHRDITQRLKRAGFVEGRAPLGGETRSRVWLGMELGYA